MRSTAFANPSIVALLLAFWLAPARAGDWPQVLGPIRNGIAAADERLAETWPAGGPPVEWRRDVGAGYAGVAVADGRAILFSRVGDREIVEGIDAATGKTLWSDGHPTTFVPQVGGGNGPLCTPVIHGSRVIVFGAQGVLACLDVATGKRLWQHDTHRREFDAPEGYFGAGSTPLVMAGDAAEKRLLVTAAYGIGSVHASFDGKAAQTLWEGIDSLATQYCTPIAMGGVLYAIDGRDDVPPADLKAVEAETGLSAGRLYVRDDSVLTCLRVGP